MRLDNIEWKLIGGFLLLMALFSVDAWLANKNLAIVAANRRIVAHSQQVIGEVHATLSALKDAETGQRGYLLANKAEYLQPYNSGLTSVFVHLGELKRLTRDNLRQQERVALLDRAVRQTLEEMQATLATKQMQGDVAARQRLVNNTGQKMDEARRLGTELESNERILLNDRETRSDQSESNARVSFGIAFMLSIVLMAGFFATIRNSIQERQHAAAAVHERETRRSAILESAMDAIVTVDFRGRVVEWNPVAETLFGYSRDAVMNRDMANLIIPPDQRERHRKGLAHYLDTGEGPLLNKRLEIVGLAADGTEVPVELTITPIKQRNGAPLFTAFIRDIRERKRHELERDRLTRYNQLLLESTAEGIFGTDLDGRCTFINQAGARLLGYLPEEVVGQTLHALIHRHYPDGTAYPEDRCPMQESLVGRVVRRGEDEYFWRKDGTLFPVEYSSVPLIENDVHMGSVVTFSDISARKRAEEEVLAAKEAAETANSTKSQFLANMSHELRTPLNAIIGYSEMMAEDAEDNNSDTLGDLRKIHKAGKHLLSLINNILDLSKIEAGKMDLFVETFDVDEMIDEVAATIQPLVEKNGNRLVLERTAPIGLMSADFTKMRQILFNLLSNAAKFTERGLITLAVSRETRNSVDGVHVRVADTGVGISREQQERLFEAFSQADASTTRKFGGTGLGLAITRRFCVMMGGDIQVESDEGKGSVFTMWIPVSVSAPSTPSSEAQSASISELLSAAPSPLILTIDDDPSSRELLQRSLGRDGFRVETAASGEEGLRLARELHPTAITLDVMMPRMDGWAVLKALKADPELADIPVIMLTMVNNQNLAQRLGASEYMTKPIDRGSLLALLDKYRCGEPPCTVLLVEDDQQTRDMMREVLMKEKWVVLAAENGQAALSQLRKRQPNLVLLDLMMPGMDGFELAATLQDTPDWATIPIVVLTAKDLTKEDMLRLNGSVARVLHKGSASREEIVGSIREIVTNHSPREAVSTASPR